MTDTFRKVTILCDICHNMTKKWNEIQDFAKFQDHECQECGNIDISWWSRICTGSNNMNYGQTITGFWPFKKVKFKESFRCGFLNSVEKVPKHFHLICNRCNHKWTMLTKSETNRKKGIIEKYEEAIK